MSKWRVYIGTPAPVTCRSERDARKLSRKLKRLGLTTDLYEADGSGGWDLRESHLDVELKPEVSRPADDWLSSLPGPDFWAKKHEPKGEAS